MAFAIETHGWWRWITAPQQNFLRWAIALSLLAHAVIIAWSFPPTAARPVPAPRLEVVMINTGDTVDPLVPSVIAQASLEGGGDVKAPDVIASNPAPRLGKESMDLSLEAMTRQKQTLKTSQTQLLSQTEESWEQPLSAPESKTEEAEAVLGDDPTDQQAIALNARIAAILEDIQHYNARPRRHFDAPSAIANRYARYIDAWRQAVENTGSEHYPGDATDRPTGQVQVTVTIDAQGQVVRTRIDRPARDPRLNQAISRILQLAGPFAPFPAEFRDDIDELVITRTWAFTPGQLTTRVVPESSQTSESGDASAQPNPAGVPQSSDSQ